MTLGFGGGPGAATCRFCVAATHPEVLSELVVPYFGDATFEICPACREDYEGSGWQARPFAPAAELPGHYLWPEPGVADLEGTDGELRAGVEAYLEARRRTRRIAREEAPVRARLAAAASERPLQRLWLREERLARLAFGLDPELERLLLAAWEALDDALPSYAYKTGLHARIAALLARLTLELGERAPTSYGPRKSGPAAWLKELRDLARQQPALRDPRVPLLRALLYREEDHLGGVDGELREARRWLEERVAAEGRPEAWAEVELAILYDLHLRAADAGRWVEARDLLKRCCALRPAEPQLFLRLARTYLACAQPQVAREVLAAQLGASRVTPSAVDEAVAGSLRELRPLLEERQRAHPDEPLRVLYGACLLGLGEVEGAWRAVAGDELLAAEPDEVDPEQVERLHLGGRVARARGDLEGAVRLLTSALASAPPSVRPAVQHDLLGAVAGRARELLEDLEERTRAPAARRAELRRALEAAEPAERADLQAELERLDDGLAEVVRGDEASGDPLTGLASGPGLAQLHELVRRNASALLAAAGEWERGVLVGFLGRELGGYFRPLVTPPGLEDRDDVRVSDARLRIDLTYLALAKRRLPQAVREDRAARDVAGHAAPIHLLLTYLELVRRGGPRVHAWAVHAWAQLPAPHRPVEAGLLLVSSEALERRDVAFLTELFEDPGRGPTVGRPTLRALHGRCQLVFPGDAALPALARDPQVRGYVQTLFAACPAFPFLLDPSQERGQLELFFGCLASPDALQDAPPYLQLLDASVLDPVRRALTAVRELAAALGLDPAAASAPLLERYPPERRDELFTDSG